MSTPDHAPNGSRSGQPPRPDPGTPETDGPGGAALEERYAAALSNLQASERELRATNERHRLLIAAVAEYAIFMLDPAGRVTTWNTGAERIFGFDDDEVIGRDFSILFLPEDREAGAPQSELSRARETGQAQDERWHLRKGGERFWASGVLTGVHDEFGALCGFAKVLRDNTRRREQELALRESEEQLRALNETLELRVARRTEQLAAANERIRRLAAEVVMAEQRERERIAQRLHDDLQQRLYAVQMRIPLLRQAHANDKPERVRQGFADLEHWMAGAVRLTRQITIDLSPPVLKGEGLPEALDWLVDQMAEMHDLEVIVKGSAKSDPDSRKLRILLFQSVRELLFNVVKHAGVKHALVLLAEDEGQLRIEVIDDGVGFDPGEIEISAPSLENFGLAEIRERLALVDGSLAIDSKPGTGTRVTIRVPRVLAGAVADDG